MKRINDEFSFILHRRPYLETSLLVDIFTENYGRLNLIVRGVRKAKSSEAFLWQPFIPLKIGWCGRTDLPTATYIEKIDEVIHLTKEVLLVGLYLNELLMSVLPKYDPYPEVFKQYYLTLQEIKSGLKENKLRSFEKKLLSELGYGLPDSHDVDHKPIDPLGYYQLQIGKGFVLTSMIDAEKSLQGEHPIFSGKVILDFLHESWTKESLPAAKIMMRLLLKPLLQFKPLYTRELFLTE